MKILIFGGTTEGRLLSEKLFLKNYNITLVVATEYGEKLASEYKGIDVIAKRLDENQMIKFIGNNFDVIIDTTHPFADIVSKNIKNACLKCGIEYIRLIREITEKADNKSNVVYVDNYKEAVDILNYSECSEEYDLNEKNKGNVLLTTGSKNLEDFTNVIDYKERVYVRVIPMVSSLEKAISLGYAQKNIICMQGPFSYELNLAMLSSLKIKFLVTKDSGKIGGVDEKIKSAIDLGIKSIVIKRPLDENGLRFEEVLHRFSDE